MTFRRALVAVMVVSGLGVAALAALAGDHEQAAEYLAAMALLLVACWEATT